MFSNESYVFKRVSFLNRVPFQTSIVYESYRDDFYRVLLAWFTRNLEWSNNTSYWRFITYERTIYATSFPGSLSLRGRLDESSWERGCYLWFSIEWSIQFHYRALHVLDMQNIFSIVKFTNQNHERLKTSNKPWNAGFQNVVSIIPF